MREQADTPPIDWRRRAISLEWRIRPFIAGGYRRSTGSDVLHNVDPSTESVLCSFAAGTAEDIDDAVRVARARYREGVWSRLPTARRAETLLRLADLIVANKEQLALLESLEMGKPISAAIHEVEALAAAILRDWAGQIERLVGESAPRTTGAHAYTLFQPKGVIGAIVPWNFPTANAIIKLAPALAAGNSVVLKPSEIAPSSSLKVAELAIEAGIPEGVLNIVPGAGPTAGAALALHADVDMISFTGSTVTGRRVMEMAGRSNGKAVLLECGGKSPHVVFDDIEDLPFAVDQVANGFLWNGGQVCSAGTRAIVQEGIYEPFLELLIERSRRSVPAHALDPLTTFGPLASPMQRDRVRTSVNDAVQAGASPALLGQIQDQDGCFVSPTIFRDVDSWAEIAQQEVFGPVLCVQSFEDAAAAVALANNSSYGLCATVWTSNLGRAMRMINEIEAGSVTVRTSEPESGALLPQLGYEPFKASGIGCEVGLRGLQSYSKLKLVGMLGV